MTDPPEAPEPGTYWAELPRRRPSAVERERRRAIASRRRRIGSLVLLGAAAAIGGVAIGITAFGGHSAGPAAIPTGPATVILSVRSGAVAPPGAGSSADPVGGSASPSSDGPLTVDQARAAVVAYLADVNSRDRGSAGALICQSMYQTWLDNSDSPSGDFAYSVIGAQYVDAVPQAGSGAIVITYELKFNDQTLNTVHFTVVNQTGAKLCGITSG